MQPCSLAGKLPHYLARVPIADSERWAHRPAKSFSVREVRFLNFGINRGRIQINQTHDAVSRIIGPPFIISDCLIQLLKCFETLVHTFCVTLRSIVLVRLRNSSFAPLYIESARILSAGLTTSEWIHSESIRIICQIRTDTYAVLLEPDI